MSPQAQRIAIAKACGWKDEIVKAFHGLPDYLNDLNAMHEAEKVLTERQRLFYQVWLMKIQKADYQGGSWYAIHAAAAQRAEAFLRTIGKWEEEAQP